jgi:hypothetical protein
VNELRIVKELQNAPVAFGLDAQGHLPTIEQMLAGKKTWAEIANQIGWDEITLRAHWQLHNGDPQTRPLRFALAQAVATLDRLKKRHGQHFNGIDDNWIEQSKWTAADILGKDA